MKPGKMGREKAIHHCQSLVLSNFRQTRIITIVNAVVKVVPLWCGLDEEIIVVGNRPVAYHDHNDMV